ncbi:hypothetical protein RZS08_49640, partial [Arthrospira platensis SPKY1]|nr:hypothetical protein [Arthrospira platensis SPKY1]
EDTGILGTIFGRGLQFFGIVGAGAAGAGGSDTVFKQQGFLTRNFATNEVTFVTGTRSNAIFEYFGGFGFGRIDNRELSIFDVIAETAKKSVEGFQQGLSLGL